MSTATAEPEVIAEVLVQQPDPSVLFVAKRSDLRLVHTARYPIMVPNTGQRIGMTAGVVVAFNQHEFRCPLAGEVKIMDPGGAGEARMPADELLAFLESHPRCGDPNEGFQRVDPKAPPLGQAEQERLMAAATDWDVETLAAIVAQERAGWNRAQVIDVAEGSIQRINEAMAQAEAKARADVEAEAKAKGK